MKTISITSALVAGLAFSLGAGAAEAGTKTFTITGNAIMGGSGYFFEGPALSGTSGASALFNIALPDDYMLNSPVKVVLRMFTVDTACNDVFNVVGTYRSRRGSPYALAVGPASGLTFNSASTFSVPSVTQQVFVKSLTLAGATGIPVSGQKAGDQIVGWIARDGSAVADTCSSTTTVNSIKVTYFTP